MKKMLALPPIDRFEALDEWLSGDLTLELRTVPEVSDVIEKWRQIPSSRALQPRPSHTRRTSRRSVLAVGY